MDIPLDKVIPRALALAAVVYCLWPSMKTFFEKPKPESPEKVPEITAALLSPSVPPAPTRDPFERITAELASKRKRIIPPAAKDTKGKQRQQSESTTAAQEGQKQRRSTHGSPPESARAGAGKRQPVALNLEATCIVGDRRLAVINGRLYAPEDTLPSPGPWSSPCRVVRVLPYKVVLKRGGKFVELFYANSAAKPASAAKKSSVEKSPPPENAPRNIQELDSP